MLYVEPKLIGIEWIRHGKQNFMFIYADGKGSVKNLVSEKIEKLGKKGGNTLYKVFESEKI